ncbi:MAG: Esterase [Chitinophagaceae bacterium]|nr:Esterase [Chitinophagaceae bacterium]
MQNNFLTKAAGFLCLFFVLHTGTLAQTGVSIIDSRHYSNVFGEIRNYRIFLPPGYYKNPGKKYPVIYFLHGWSQRYFGSSVDRYAEYDKGSDNKGDNMEKFVAHHDVIVVKSDGYNRDAREEYYLRPYNIGPVETFRQFPVYFPELIAYIDATYHTKAERDSRAVSGLSMGGFMAFMIGGKYPHLFCAVGNFCGSPEFIIGPKDLPVEYRHLDMYKNYDGVNIRLNYGDKDFIRGYHEDLNKVWTQVMDNYQYKIYPGEHSTIGLGEMFDFLFTSFSKPIQKPRRWNHIDLYPEFSVWDYSIRTDRTVPGFTVLENTDQRGFKCSVRELLPDGELMPFVNVSVVTAPVYELNQWYIINDIDVKGIKTSRDTIRSDQEGRLRITFNGSVHEIGINKKVDKPNIAMAAFKIKNMDWPTPGKEVVISVKLINKGLTTGKIITAGLSANDHIVHIKKGESTFGSIGINESKTGEIPYVFQVINDSIEIVKFKLTIRDANKNEWIEFFEVPVMKDVPEIKNFKIADGTEFTVAKNGTDSETLVIGHGNGDGIANAGESIEILVKDQDKYWRTKLTFSDSAVDLPGINIRKSENWGSFDHVGGSMKYSVPILSSKYSGDHELRFFAEYWLPDKPLHIIKQGKIVISVSGSDHEPPLISWVNVPGDNILQAKIQDGSKIKSVVATLTAKDKNTFKINLNDGGKEGDRAEGDNIFSKMIPAHEFGFYKVSIEAMDLFGNKTLHDVPDEVILH